MPIDKKRRILFVHIPKCAGTSIERVLNWTEAYPNIGLEPTKTQPNYDTLFGGELQHLTIKEISRMPGISVNGYLSFAVLRDPVERLISHFLWYRYHFKNIEDVLVSEVQEDFRNFVDDLITEYQDHDIFRDPYKGFEYNEIYEHKSFLLRHIIPQCSYVFDEYKLSVNHLLPFSTFVDDLVKLLPETSSLKQEKRMVSPYKRWNHLELVDDSTEERIKSFYRDDFLLYDNLREKHKDRTVTKFIRSNKFHSHVKNQRNIPRRVWMLWLQGWKQAPLIPKISLQSWKRMNPNWDIVLLDKNSVFKYIDVPLFIEQNLDLINPTALSDIVRIYLLVKYGGVWADATTLCACPLDNWIDYACRKEGFFAYSEPVQGRPLSSWFLASSKSNYLSEKWLDCTDKRWSDWFINGFDPDLIKYLKPDYFWFHNCFKKLIETNPLFSQKWNNCLKISAKLPHCISGHFHLTYNDRVKDIILNHKTSVLKLHSRIDYRADPDFYGFQGSALELFLKINGLMDETIGPLKDHKNRSPILSLYGEEY